MQIPIKVEDDSLLLRAAGENDLENLRQWKNGHRKYFFYKEMITPEQQRAWFNGFQARSNDYMFIVEANGVSIGCMGIRLLDEAWDIYNVILGLPDYGKKGLMGKAFQAMLTYAQTIKKCPATLQVLKINPAVAWYQKHGFAVTAGKTDHYSMALSNNI